jgi:serine protease Do
MRALQLPSALPTNVALAHRVWRPDRTSLRFARVLSSVLVVLLSAVAFAQDLDEQRALSLQNLYQYSILHLTVEGIPDQQGQGPEEVARGTGFIVSSNGHVITAAHLFGVPGRYRSYTVKARLQTSTTNSFETAAVIKIDRDLDVALLKLPRPGSISQKWYRAPIGNSRLVIDSAPVIALGFPEELTTLQRARGYVTDLNGPKGWLQINAVVSRGYSGGPVFNEFGEVIGIVTAGYINPAIKYAIPINYASGLLNLTGQ